MGRMKKRSYKLSDLKLVHQIKINKLPERSAHDVESSAGNHSSMPETSQAVNLELFNISASANIHQDRQKQLAKDAKLDHDINTHIRELEQWLKEDQ